MAGIEARFHLDWPGFCLDVDPDLPGRGITALFGHSGSGKTMLLRCIAGLERVRNGRLVVADEVWQDTGRWLPTHKRPIGYVFQEASLFPHLTALGNLRYGLRRMVDARWVNLDQVIELLGIGHLLDRKPDRLSGGERQRVAIARALAVSPRLSLMDEPLAALDMKRKQEILPYLERLHDELNIPVLYVSHSPDEVARLADHLVVMEGGKAKAGGPLAEMLTRLDPPIRLGEGVGTLITQLPRCARRHRYPNDPVRPGAAGIGGQQGVDTVHVRCVGASRCGRPSRAREASRKSRRVGICVLLGWARAAAIVARNAMRRNRGNRKVGDQGHGRPVPYDSLQVRPAPSRPLIPGRRRHPDSTPVPCGTLRHKIPFAPHGPDRCRPDSKS